MQECRQAIEALEYSGGFPLEKEEDFNRSRFSLEASRERLDGLRRDEGKSQGLHHGGRDPGDVRKHRLLLGLALAVALGVVVGIAGNATAGLIAGALIAAGTLVLLQF